MTLGDLNPEVTAFFRSRTSWSRTDFSVFNCRYSLFFGIPNTDVGIVIVCLNIGYRFGIFGITPILHHIGITPMILGHD